MSGRRELAAGALEALRAVERELRNARHRARRRAAVTAAERAFLHALHVAGRQTLCALAARLVRDPSTVCIAAKRLAARGLVTRHADTHDRRRCWLAITPAGRRALERTSDCEVTRVRRALAAWAPRERERLVRLLARLTSVVSVIEVAAHAL